MRDWQATQNTSASILSFRCGLRVGQQLLLALGLLALPASGLGRQLHPASPPSDVYVDRAYAGMSGQVTFPAVGGTGAYHIGYDAFAGIQNGLNAVARNGRVHIAPGNYVEDLAITNPVTLLGPNAGKAGADPTRGSEAIVMPASADPESGQIVYLGASDVAIDGLILDGHNPAFPAAQGYGAGGKVVYSSAAVQNTWFWTTDFAQVDRFTLRNSIIRNLSYDGVYLELDLGRTNGFNYILNNKFDTLWEGLSTYAVHSIISNNTFVSVNRGVSLHGTTVPASVGFSPSIVSNSFTLAEWWPTNINRQYSAGVWVNYRRQQAAPLEVSGNHLLTPAPAPSGKTIRGFYALTIDGSAKVSFRNNSINGYGNCHQGLLAAGCSSNNAIQVIGGCFGNILQNGILADTLDPVYGAGDAFVAVSNLSITMSSAGAGAAAIQETSTPSNKAQLTVLGNTSISGASAGILVQGSNAALSVVSTLGSISANAVGIEVNAGRALLEGTTLTNNSIAGIRIENNGVVDAGDCTGGNITGLGTGSGPNGASAGLNDLSGYGFDGRAPFAITNAGSVTAAAQENFFGASPADNIALVLAGPVNFAQAGGSLVSSPPPLAIQCLSEVPPGATTLPEFIALGGLATATPATVAYSDAVSSPAPHVQVVTRTYTVTDLCGHAASCDQVITVEDTLPPTPNCPGNLIQSVDAGHNYATVNFSVAAVDNCDPAPDVAAAPPPGWFPLGTTPVTVTATDASGNSASCTFTVTVVVPPFITNQPAGLTVAIGAPAVFIVGAGGSAPLQYQWRQNGLAIPGQTTGTLTIPSAADTDAGDYTVLISNAGGSLLSAAAHLTLIHPPVISAQPADASVNLGDSANFNVSATGQTPFTYQWQKNGAAIAGATSRILSIGRALAADAGSYRVTISNSDGATSSRDASLNIIFPPTHLVLCSYSNNALTMTGADGYRYALFGNTNLFGEWLGLVTNTAPYIFQATNPSPNAFYRGAFVP